MIRVPIQPPISAFLHLALYNLHLGRPVFPSLLSPLVNRGLVIRDGDTLLVTREGRAMLLERVTVNVTRIRGVYLRHGTNHD